MLRIPPGLFEGPLPAIAVLMVILFAALKAPSSLAVFAAALAVFSAAAFAVVPLFASDPMSFLLSLDAVSADRVHEVARWVWAASAYAAALALAVDGWRG